eukprot:403346838
MCMDSYNKNNFMNNLDQNYNQKSLKQHHHSKNDFDMYIMNHTNTIQETLQCSEVHFVPIFKQSNLESVFNYDQQSALLHHTNECETQDNNEYNEIFQTADTIYLTD